MAKKKRRYFVNVPEATKFLKDAYSLRSREVNYYHLQIWHDDFDGLFNWYHTQGTVVVQTEKYQANIGSAGTDEDVAILISDYVSKKLHE
jgi:hypothetical protein